MKNLTTILQKLELISVEKDAGKRQELLFGLRAELQQVFMQDITTTVFEHHDISEVLGDLQQMYFNFMTNNETSGIDRQSATVTYMTLAKLLTAFDKMVPPNEVKKVTISV
ncbi:hypothetical protein V3Q77_08335 [Flavobacterium davisii]|uniref:Uncharacterized protein n=1 Tax=Flavobacterium davisii TaxID=2906077 RepID=A0ABW8PR50_9FLAO